MTETKTNKTFLMIATAASLTWVVTEITAVALFLSVFLTMESGDTVLERWGLVPSGWGAGHQIALLIGAAIPTAICAAIVARVFYRRAIAVECQFQRAAAQ